MSGDNPKPEAADRLLVMGQIAAPYGIKGWLHVTPYTEYQDGLLDYPDWYLRIENEWRAIRPLQGRVHGKGLVVQLEGCTDRDQAARYSGAQIAVYRSQLPDAGAEEFYWSDLTGLAVYTTAGQYLGKVDHLFETGANDVLVVRGEREHLVPYIRDQVIRSVDLAQQRMVVDWDADF